MMWMSGLVLGIPVNLFPQSLLSSLSGLLNNVARMTVMEDMHELHNEGFCSPRHRGCSHDSMPHLRL